MKLISKLVDIKNIAMKLIFENKICFIAYILFFLIGICLGIFNNDTLINYRIAFYKKTTEIYIFLDGNFFQCLFKLLKPGLLLILISYLISFNIYLKFLNYIFLLFLGVGIGTALSIIIIFFSTIGIILLLFFIVYILILLLSIILGSLKFNEISISCCNYHTDAGKSLFIIILIYFNLVILCCFILFIFRPIIIII